MLKKIEYIIVPLIISLFMAQSVAASPVKAIANKERRLAKALLDKRWKEAARQEKVKASSDRKTKISALKEEARLKREKIGELFRDGKVYCDAHFYKEAIATWYDVLVSDPAYKDARDDRIAEALIITAQKALKEYNATRKTQFKEQAKREAKLARADLEKAKKRLECLLTK